MGNDNNPLVSIIVITYNSAKYVLETLESAKAQTYQNIELIVSDDYSDDDTVHICREWIEDNKVRFIRTKLITSPVNTGIAANCNRGLKVSIGEWIKYIAGDDILFDNCISDNINFIGNNNDINILHSSMAYYLENFDKTNFLMTRSFKDHLIASKNITPYYQHKILLRGCFINTPSVFIKRSNLAILNGFDESIPIIEDWPLWLKITNAGIKIHYMNKVTIKYRKRMDSVCNEGDDQYFFNKHFYRERIVYLNYIRQFLPAIERYYYNFNFFRLDIVLKYFNKKNKFNLLVIRSTSPFILIYKKIYLPILFFYYKMTNEQ